MKRWFSLEKIHEVILVNIYFLLVVNKTKLSSCTRLHEFGRQILDTGRQTDMEPSFHGTLEQIDDVEENLKSVRPTLLRGVYISTLFNLSELRLY